MMDYKPNISRLFDDRDVNLFWLILALLVYYKLLNLLDFLTCLHIDKQVPWISVSKLLLMLVYIYIFLLLYLYNLIISYLYVSLLLVYYILFIILFIISLLY